MLITKIQIKYYLKHFYKGRKYFKKYKCSVCKHTFKGKLEKCPKCHITLIWKRNNGILRYENGHGKRKKPQEDYAKAYFSK